MKFAAVLALMLCSLTVRTNEFAHRAFSPEKKLFIVTLDGFRWQEVFGGADPALLKQTNDGRLNALFGAATKEERRQKLLPFFWNVLAQEGELFGNREKKSFVNVANPYALSYPGYNELLTGSVDLTLFNNGKTLNQNRTLLNELNESKAYHGKVAAFASWDAFSFILNQAKKSLPVNSGFSINANPPKFASATALQAITDDDKNTRNDELTYAACRGYVQTHQPSVVFLSFSGTDEEAHKKKYGAYLQEAHKADRLIGELWQWLQGQPAYRGKTTLLLTTDHGRGSAADNWHTHGLFVGGSSQTWMGLMGPTVPALGERKASPQLYNKNFKTLALRLLEK